MKPMKSWLVSLQVVSMAACGIAVSGMTAYGVAANAQPVDAGVTYKCPNRIYSNTMGAREAKEKGCTVLDNAPVTVIQSTRPRPVPSVVTGRVEAFEQRNRDADARRILESELNREQSQLSSLKEDYNNGQPERQGNERNYQKYLNRVADMKAAISRKEGDVAALRREIGKLPQ